MGINRSLNRVSIIKGVRDGIPASEFFVENVARHSAEFRKSTENYFPERKNQFDLGCQGRSALSLTSVAFLRLASSSCPSRDYYCRRIEGAG